MAGTQAFCIYPSGGSCGFGQICTSTGQLWVNILHYLPCHSPKSYSQEPDWKVLAKRLKILRGRYR
jgi:hypothetical protein